MSGKGRTTELGWLILRAMDAKGADLGHAYTYAELGKASGYDGSNVARVVKGQRGASRELIEAVANALRPYLDRDEALLAAGYLPDTPAGGVVRRLWRDLRSAPLEVERRLRIALLEGVPPEEEAGQRRDRKAGDHEPRAQA